MGTAGNAGGGTLNESLEDTKKKDKDCGKNRSFGHISCRRKGGGVVEHKVG